MEKRLLLINNGYPSERYPNYTTWAASIAECLKKVGFCVNLLVIYYNHNNTIYKLIKYIYYFCNLIIKDMSGYDIIYINYPTHAFPVFFNKTFEKNKACFHWHGYDLIGSNIYNKFAHRYLKFKFRQCLHFVPSNHYKNILVDKFDIEENKISISPSGGVNINILKKSNIKWSNKKEKFTIGFASGLSIDKGVILLYEIVKKYKYLEKKMKCRVEFCIINYAKEARKYIEKIKKDKLPVEVWEKMKKKEMVQFYNAIDLLLMTSKTESLGLVVLEAMSCEVPVITFDSSAFPDFVISKISGERVKYENNIEDNIKGFLEAIIAAKDNYDSYRPRNIVVKEYSEEITVDKYRKILNLKNG